MELNTTAFKAIIDQTSEGAYWFDSKNVLVYANKSGYSILGYSPSELMGQHISLINPRATNEAMENVWKRLRSVGTYTIESSHKRKNGEYFPVEITTTLVSLDEGEFYIGFARDITERKQAEEALKESEALFRDMFERHAAVKLVIKPDSGQIVDANAAALKFYGWTREELLKKRIQEINILSPEEIFIEMQRALKGNKNHFEFRHRLADGSIKDVEIFSSTINTKNDTLLYTIIHDSTERKNSERALIENKARLSAAIDIASLGLYELENGNNLVYASPKARDILAVSEIGPDTVKYWHSNLYSDDISKVMEVKRTLYERETDNVCVEYRYNHPERGMIWVRHVSRVALCDSQNSIVRVTGVIQDITEQKKTEEFLKNADKLESISVLAGGIAHDLNNLLQTLFHNIEMAKRHAERDACYKSSDYLTKAMTVFDRTQALTQQLLSFSKSNTPVLRNHSIKTLLEKTVAFALSGSHLELKMNIENVLWDCCIDPHQIAQVVDNIVINARQSLSENGCVEVTASNLLPDIAPKTFIRGKYVKVSIADNGQGISPENLPHIFTPFYTTKKEGSGLGLATCYRIITEHKGYIDVESVFGKGATFHIYLPASEVDTHSKTEINEQEFLFKGKMLLMDDDQGVCEAMGAIFTDLGLTVVTANNGTEAIEKANEALKKNEPFILSLLDLTIAGGLGGYEVCKQLKDLDPNLKIIATSGYSEDPIILRPIEYGFTDSIAKPYSLASISHIFRRLLN
ncbi:MAG: PAS domain S-box protein [Fibrobacteres bacterium]|nr:PAS domain S-box protein [Fibrobacterota bacterium]